MTTEEIKLEYQKCKENPLYWYNNYCTINGKKVEPLTQEQWDTRLSEINYQRNRRSRNKDVYNLLPTFLQEKKK